MLNQSPTPSPVIAPNGARLTVRAVVIVYEVKEGKRTFSVSVTLTGAMACSCQKFKYYGECQHLEAVQIERKSVPVEEARRIMSRGNHVPGVAAPDWIML